MKSLRLFFSAAALAVLPAILGAADHGHGEHHNAAAGLDKAQEKFLANYEGVRAALASDDLAAAKRSAGNISDNAAAAEIAKASSIDAARTAFKKLSANAVKIANGQKGYYVATCPMAHADWVQTKTTISNPYYGKSMLTCGSIKN